MIKTKIVKLKIFKKILIILILLIVIILVVLFDHADRSMIYSKAVPEEELSEFKLYSTTAEVKQAYKRHFQDSKYFFPRSSVKKILIYRNIPFASRFTGREVNKEEILEFVNNPENFDWGETTWSLDNSEYILRFYDFKNKEIGKIWLCIIDCGMTESIPFAPTMKFGALSLIGKEKLSKMIKVIYE